MPSQPDLDRLRSIKTLPSLIAYLRDELDWPIEADETEDVTFDYDPEELGFDTADAVHIKEIKQLRPLDASIEPANRLAEVEYGIKRRGFSGSEGARDRARFVSAHRLGGVASPVCRGLEFGPRKSSWPPCRRCL